MAYGWAHGDGDIWAEQNRECSQALKKFWHDKRGCGRALERRIPSNASGGMGSPIFKEDPEKASSSESATLETSASMKPQKPVQDLPRPVLRLGLLSFDGPSFSEPCAAWQPPSRRSQGSRECLEEAAVLAWMPEGERKLNEHRSEVLRLKMALQRATLRAAWAEHIVKGTASALHTLNQVPNEIWLQIFEHASGPGWPKTHLRDLAGVCQKWRTVLTNGVGGSLWNPLDLRGYPPCDPDDRKMRLKYIASSHRIDLLLSDSTAVDEVTLPCILAEPRLSRVAVEHLYSPGGHARSLLSAGSLPSIDVLHVQGPAWYDSDFPCMGAVPRWAALLQDSQRKPGICISKDVRSLTLIHTVDPESDFVVPWGAIRHYAEADTARADGTLPASHLRRLTSLTKLSLRGVFLPGLDAKNGVLEIPTLTELFYVVPWQWRSESDTFSGVSFPQLASLELLGATRAGRRTEEASDRFHRDLTTFLARCPNLTHLSLGLQVPYRSNVLLSHLRACPQLQDLEVKICHPELVDAVLFLELRDLLVVPRLQHLALAEGGYPEVGVKPVEDEGDEALTHAILGMMEARFGVAKNFETLDFRMAVDPKEEWQGGIRERDWTNLSAQWGTGFVIPDRTVWLLPMHSRKAVLRYAEEHKSLEGIFVNSPRCEEEEQRTEVSEDEEERGSVM
ncbi:hypothetical protein R3P38DRAFT_2802008 [Favolaschia claudopus]|uniref:F-box domain-containing protein n=1 Tax=Favolaschia claudopus TaxID=2862362 RepID=A0AAV9ZV57_9AGAR